MSPELVTILMFGSLVIALMLGLPMSFSLGGLAVVFTLLLWGPNALSMIALKTFGGMSNFVLAAIPLFVFMATMLGRSGITDDLYEMMHRLMGSLRGGLAMGTVLVGTGFAAMCGVSAASTTAMGLVALPSLRKRNYDKDIALGSIMAGGALGILIPPSITMILLGFIAEVSVGKLFMGGILPGLLLSALFITYIAVRCFFQPHLGPPLPPEERPTRAEKLQSLRSVIFPILMVITVLGSIIAGIATPTEAAALGAAGSIMFAALKRRLTWQVLKETCYETMLLSSIIMWIIFGAMCFTGVYHALGAEQLIAETIAIIPGERWGVIIVMQLILIVMGMFLDPSGIIMIVAPIYFPIIKALGFDEVWFGVLFIVNMEMSFLTPPFGANLFALRAIVPKDISMADIIHSTTPFVILQAIGLALVMIFPQIILWIPNTLTN